MKRPQRDKRIDNLSSLAAHAEAARLQREAERARRQLRRDQERRRKEGHR